MKTSTPAALITLTLALLALSGSRADAATYEVASCQENVRERIPASDWLLEPSGADFEMHADCATAPVVMATRYGIVQTPIGAGAGLTFSVPPPLRVVRERFRMLLKAPRSLDSSKPWWWNHETFLTTTEGRTYRTGGCEGVVTACSMYVNSPTHALPTAAQSLTWFLRCADQSPNPCPYSASLTVFDAVFEVEDNERPQLIGNPEGALIAGGVTLCGRSDHRIPRNGRRKRRLPSRHRC